MTTLEFISISLLTVSTDSTPDSQLGTASAALKKMNDQSVQMAQTFVPEYYVEQPVNLPNQYYPPLNNNGAQIINQNVMYPAVNNNNTEKQDKKAGRESNYNWYAY